MQHDFREAEKSIQHAYRTYCRLKTALLEETLRDVLDEGEIVDEDFMGLDVSQVVDGECLAPFELPREIPTLEKTVVSTIFDDDPEQKVFEAAGEINQSSVWGSNLNKKAISKNDSKKKEEAKLPMPKLNAKKSFTMRNPRKSFNRSMSKMSSGSSFNFSQGNEEVLPDLETILMEKAKRHDIENVPKNANLSEKTQNPINSVDIGWLNRRNPSDNVPIEASVKNPSYGLGNVSRAALPKEGQTSFGLSALRINSDLCAPISETVQIPPEDKKFHESEDDSDAMVPNSDDESTIIAMQHRRSIRHVMKRRRLNEDTSQQSVSVPDAKELESPKKPVEKEKTPSPKKSPKQRTPIKVIQRTPTRRSTRVKRDQVSYQPITELEEEREQEPDPFACDDDSDQDPLFKDAKEEKELEVKKKQEIKKEKAENAKKEKKVADIKPPHLQTYRFFIYLSETE